MSKTILIIDDDPVIVKYLVTLFNDNGYETITANSGMEGAEQIKKIKPDLITLDLEMPDEWGPRFYRKLTKNKTFKDIPVIVISGLRGAKYSISKAVAYFSKPFDADRLLDVVRNTIN